MPLPAKWTLLFGQTMAMAVAVLALLTTDGVDATRADTNRLDLAFSEYKRSHRQTAVNLLLDLAERGDADAQYLLAEILWHSARLTPDDGNAALTEAKVWAQRAAAQHHAGGLLLYAAILQDACSVTSESFDEALTSLREAALLGLSEAQAELAWLHIDYGRIDEEAMRVAEQAADQGNILGQLAAGVIYAFPASSWDIETPDISGLRRAATYLERAAEQGLVDAQVMYAQMLALGLGVEQDGPEALKWFTIARMLGWDQSETTASELVTQMTPSEIAEIQRRAQAWIDAALIDESRPVGPALAWCDQFGAEDESCRRAAIWEDETCLPLDLAITPLEGFRQSQIYNACRTSMRSHDDRC